MILLGSAGTLPSSIGWASEIFSEVDLADPPPI